jgi:hypothetical protein
MAAHAIETIATLLDLSIIEASLAPTRANMVVDSMAVGFLTPRSSSGDTFPDREIQWFCRRRRPWLQWRGPCRFLTGFPDYRRAPT